MSKKAKYLTKWKAWWKKRRWMKKRYLNTLSYVRLWRRICKVLGNRISWETKGKWKESHQAELLWGKASCWDRRCLLSALYKYIPTSTTNKNRCIIKSRVRRRNLYKHTNIPHIIETEQRWAVGEKENMGENGHCTVVEEESR